VKNELLLWGTLICLNIATVLQTIGYYHKSNSNMLFVAGTAFIVLSVILTAVNLVNSLRSRKSKNP